MAETPSRTARLILALERRSDRPWFLPAVGASPLCDYVVPVLPNQMLLIGLSISLPHRWLALCLTFIGATALGAGLCAFAIQHWGQAALDQWLGGRPEAGAIAEVVAIIRHYGLPALSVIALLPWPPRTAVVACAIAGLPPLGIALAVMAGRVVPTFAMAGVGARAPTLLRRFKRIDAVLRQVEAARAVR
jgi:membrane protein YqaA with SNARE-associated domain